MTGILIVNEFVKSDKFSELFDMFDEAAKRYDIDLIKMTNGKAWGMLGENSYNGLRPLSGKDDRPVDTGRGVTGPRVFKGAGAAHGQVVKRTNARHRPGGDFFRIDMTMAVDNVHP